MTPPLRTRGPQRAKVVEVVYDSMAGRFRRLAVGRANDVPGVGYPRLSCGLVF